MNWKKLGRALVCLALVCCILVNASPIKAKATTVATGLGLGYFAGLMAACGGIVFNGLSSEQTVALGQNFKSFLQDWADTSEKVSAVNAYLDTVTSTFLDDLTSADWKNTSITASGMVISGIAAWIAKLIGACGLSIEGEAAPVDWVWYGSYVYPTFPDVEGYPHMYLVSNEYGTKLYYTVQPIEYSPYFGGTFANDEIRNSSYYYINVSSYDFSLWDGVSSYNVLFNSSQTNAVAFSGVSVLWCSTDIIDVVSSPNYLYMAGSEPSRTAPGTFVESTLITDVPTPDANGDIDPDDLIDRVPFVFDPSSLLQNTGKTDLSEAVSTVIGNLATGDLTYEQYMESVKSEAEEDTEPSVGVEVGAGALAGTSAKSFIEALYGPFVWIWEKIEVIPELITGPISQFITDVRTDMQTYAREIVYGLGDVLESLFVPDEAFVTEKVEALCVKFGFADSIVRTCKALGDGLAGVSTEPPVIYLDLGASRGSYYLGGTVPFLDLRWYAEYKPTVDALISAFLWICFVWRMLIYLPGIIAGASGIFHLMPMVSTHTAPIGAVDSGELRWRSNSDGSLTPYGSYSALLKEYHMDWHDNEAHFKDFGRYPSYEVLQELYTIFPEDRYE